MHSLYSCKVTVHLLILDCKCERQLTGLVFSPVISLKIKKGKKRFEGHIQKVTVDFNRDLVAFSLKFPRCSAFPCVLTAMSGLTQRFISVMFLVMDGIGHQKARSLPASHFFSVLKSFSGCIL